MCRAFVSMAFALIALVPTAHAGTADENKAIARRVFEEIFNQGRFEVVGELYANDFVNHAGSRDVSLAEDMAAARGWRAAAPDLKMTIQKLLVDGEFVVVLWSAAGTNSGEGNGLPATGKAFQLRGVTIWRVAEGKIREEWSAFDQGRLMMQLGLLVPAGK